MTAWFLRYGADSLVVLVVIYAQWRIGRAALAQAARRLPPARVALLKWALAAAFTALILAFAAGFHRISGHIPLPHGVTGWIHGAAFLWSFSSTGAWYIHALWKRLFALGEDFDPNRRLLVRSAGGVLAAAPFALAGFGTFVQRTDFRVREVALPVRGLPADLAGLRLVQLSDIHLSPYLSESEFARAIDAASELRPHLVLVTGDLISARGDPLDACLRQIARLRPDLGFLGCLGNHEIYAEAEQYATRQAARMGIEFLRRRSRVIRRGTGQLNIAGVDYQRITDKASYLRGTETLVRPGMPNILLSHNPDVFPVAARQGFDVTISGHTHGGQVQVEILNQSLNVARFLTPYVYGLYRENGRSVYVTRGIGTIGMPARIGAPPEIALLRLEKA